MANKVFPIFVIIAWAISLAYIEVALIYVVVVKIIGDIMAEPISASKAKILLHIFKIFDQLFINAEGYNF